MGAYSNYHSGWISAYVECDVCTERWFGVIHSSLMDKLLECPNCECMRPVTIHETFGPEDADSVDENDG